MKNPIRLLVRFLLLAVLASAGSAASAADAPKAAVTKNLLQPTATVKAWQFEETDEAKGTIKAEGDALALTVTKVDSVDWHVQAFQAGLDLAEGKEYAVTFKARASATRVAQIYVGINEEDYHAVGLDDIITLTPEWQSFTFSFKAEGVIAKNNRLGLLVGQETGTVWIKELTLIAK